MGNYTFLIYIAESALDAFTSSFKKMQFSYIIPMKHQSKSICAAWDILNVGGVGGYVIVDSKDPSNREVKLKSKESGVECVVECIRYLDEFNYVLMHNGREWSIGKIHKQKFLGRWEHVDTVQAFNQFVVYNKVIYIASRSSKCIFKYTVDGKHVGGGIPLDLEASPTFLCNTSTGLLILSQTTPSLLVCIEPVGRSAIWMRHDLVDPRCMAIDSEKNELLICTKTTNRRRATITIIRPVFGKYNFKISIACCT